MLPSDIRLEAAMVKHFGDPDADPRLRRPDQFAGKLIASFRAHDAADRMPWAKTHSIIGLRPGEVSAYVGINGHWKSTLTGQIALDLVDQGRNVAIASLEMQPWNTLKRMARQVAGGAQPADEFLIGFCTWLAQRRFLIYDQYGRANWKHIAQVVRYAAVELGVQHFFIDSLMMIVPGDDDYNAQKDCTTSLCSVAHDTGCHIHLVHHARKLKTEADVPGKFDVKGSGTIADQVDNVFIVWRNKAKEEKRAEAERIGADFDESREPDALLVCEKQRNGEWEGRIQLWWDAASMSLRGTPERPRFSKYDIPLSAVDRKEAAA